MARINDNYLKLQAGYLFPEIARRVDAFSKANPDAPIIKLGIGDVTEPLPAVVISAMHNAADEMSNRATFKGYGPDQGYPFLRDAIAQHDYQSRNCDINPDEIFISDGSKCDTGNIINILGPNNSIAIQDPSYPVYVDSNVMAGNTGPANPNNQYDGLTYLPLTAENNFNPPIPSAKIDIIYLCYPNNPTGTVASRQTLTNWVNYAKENHAIILFDAAYEVFITDPDVPHSIYEISGAREVAIEFRSFSKNAGFTGTRCAFTVIPKSLTGTTTDNQTIDLHQLWSRRQSTLFNGVPYIIQRAAEAVYSPQGQQQVNKLVSFYLENAKIIRDTFIAINFQCHGGINSPYIWIKTPNNIDSWTFFDQLLTKTHVVSTPGSGFGPSGQGYFRISAFNSRQNVIEAMKRIKAALTT